MKAIIKGNIQDLKVTSIILESDSLNPDMFLMFFCPKCSHALFQYSGTIVMIVPGGTRTPLPFIKECKTCKTRYLINSIV